MRARALTEAADKESAEAEISGGKAASEKAAAEKAERAMRTAREKHDEVSLCVCVLVLAIVDICRPV